MQTIADEQSKHGILTPARFLISGIANTAVTYFLFLGLTNLFNASIAYTLSYAVGIVIAYLLNALFVFKTGHTKRMAVAVALSYLTQYVYGLAALTLLIQIFKLRGYISMALVIAGAFPLQYLILQFVADRTKLQSRRRNE
jgi:putative flippase GtrA